MRHCTWEDYVWNPGTCACECDKDCEIVKYMKDCECRKRLVDDLVVDVVKLRTHVNTSSRINY